MAEPILRWAGSKKKLLPVLTEMAPRTYKRYVEPFAGSAILYLKMKDTPALLGDLNGDLIATYETVRSHPRRVWNKVNNLSRSSDYYYYLRSLDPAKMGKIESAARFIYLNRFCFNGVYRTNKKGEFNVARGKGHLYIPDYDVFNAFANKLKLAEIQCVDFEKIVKKTRKDDFLYLDPPYSLDGKRDRGEYGIGSFKETDLDRLVAQLKSASERGVKVLLSYSDNEYLIKQLKNWNVRKLSVMRNVSGFTATRKNAEEILLSNYIN